MNETEQLLADRLAADLGRVLGEGILVQDLEIEGEGPVTIRVACLVEGQFRELVAEGADPIEAASRLIRKAAEARTAATFWQVVGPG
jgi:hypothetical protein